MKKVLIIALALVMSFAFVACGDDKSVDEVTADPSTDEEVTQTMQTSEEETTTQEETTQESTTQEAGDWDDNSDSPYASVTGLNQEDVEAFASQVRSAYLSGDWNAISNMARYPITVSGQQINSAEEFTSFMDGKTADADSISAMEAENCNNMFVNGQGICMADGSVWFLDVNNDGIEQKDAPDLRIISLNGIN